MVTIPNTGAVRIELVPFLLANVDYIKMFDCPSKRPIYYNRNQYMETFKESSCDWLLMIDSDTIPPIDAMKKLEDVLKLNPSIKVASGWYNTFNVTINKVHPVFFWADGDGIFKNYSDQELESIEKKRFQIVDGVGGGFLLVHKSVINKLKKPFFKNVYNQEITKLFVSEDLYFSNKIKKAGEFIYLIPNIKCIHIKNINI